MKLNKNSISTKLYQFVWGEDLPNNLCAFFWKNLLAYLLLPVVTLFSLMYYPASLIPIVRRDFGDDRFSKRVDGLTTVILLFLLFCVGVFVSGYWVTYYEESFMHFVFLFGGCTLVVLSVCFVFYLIGVFGNNKPNVVKEYVKAKKGKYCPKIEWIDEK